MNEKTKIYIARYVVPFVLFMIIVALLILNIHNQRLTSSSIELIQAQVFKNMAQDAELEDLDGHVIAIYEFIDKLQRQDKEQAKSIAALHLIEERRSRSIEVNR